MSATPTTSDAAAPPTKVTNRQKRSLQIGIDRASEGQQLPQKRFFRQRAHANPLNMSGAFSFPLTPDRFDFDHHYPTAPPTGSRAVDAADVGCGFGGLTVGLAALRPDLNVLGMEIRQKVTEYVRLRILALRKGNDIEEEGEKKKAEEEVAEVEKTAAAGGGGGGGGGGSSSCHNASVILANAMKNLTNFFAKGQLSKLFFCFPDPHFKTKNHRRRIVSPGLLDEYAYCLKPGAILYHITDVKDLHDWMVKYCDEHACFVKLTPAELAADPCVKLMTEVTEEGKKVARNSGSKFPAAYRRVTDDEAVAAAAAAAAAKGPSGFWTTEPLM